MILCNIFIDSLDSGVESVLISVMRNTRTRVQVIKGKMGLLIQGHHNRLKKYNEGNLVNLCKDMRKSCTWATAVPYNTGCALTAQKAALQKNDLGVLVDK